MFAQDLLHNLLPIGLGFIAGAVTIGYFILGGMLVVHETGKVRNQ